jgi:hypothetical protein
MDEPAEGIPRIPDRRLSSAWLIGWFHPMLSETTESW